MEWTKSTYNNQYEKWVPWMEDVYLRWFTKDNKTSYTARQNLDKTKVTGVSQIDTLQDGVNNLAAGQLGQGGLLEPATNITSKEGLTRAERGGKDDQGNYAPGTSAFNSVADGGKSLAGGAADGGKAVGGAAASGVKGAGNFIGGAFGGGNKTEEQPQGQEAKK